MNIKIPITLNRDGDCPFRLQTGDRMIENAVAWEIREGEAFVYTVDPLDRRRIVKLKTNRDA